LEFPERFDELKQAFEIAIRISLLTGSMLLTIAGIELGCRLWRGPHYLKDWPNLVELARKSDDETCAYIPDADVGWLPPANCMSPRYSFDDQGFRRTPGPADNVANRPIVLTTGGSFVSAMLGLPTINAGVSGFGLDQTVLRTERLAADIHPALLVTSFTADHLRRAEMSRLWGSDKPYFSLDGDTLRLHPTASPSLSDSRSRLPFWQKWFGWSILADLVVNRLGWQEEWFSDNVRALRKEEGLQLACPLMRRIAALGIPTLVVAEYELGQAESGYDRDSVAEQRRKSQIVLRCAEQSGLSTLDLFDTVDAVVRARGIDSIYRGWHHNAEGNHLVASAIAKALGRP
jgi:hypothetical protein